MTRNAPSLVIGASTAAAGAVLLARPRQIARFVAGPGTAPPSWIVRLLGARYLAQAAAELGRPTRAVWLTMSAIDGIHAASMIAAAALQPSYRRPAVGNAVVATGSAAVTAATAWRR